MKTRLLAATLATATWAFAADVQALICSAPNPAEVINNFFAKGIEPIVVIGELALPPETEILVWPQGAMARYDVTGKRITGSGEVDLPEGFTATIVEDCWQDRCGSLPIRIRRALLIMEPVANFPLMGDAKIKPGVCSRPAFPAMFLSAGTRQYGALVRCLEAGRCDADAIEAFEHFR
ncbi:MAG: hypothetical protein AAF409_03875 [Pseudomonadota bacterium]